MCSMSPRRGGHRLCAYFLAMEYEPASVVSLVYFFKPALSPVLAWWLHGEEIPFNMLLGIVLIVAGSLCAIIRASWRPSGRERPSECKSVCEKAAKRRLFCQDSGLSFSFCLVSAFSAAARRPGDWALAATRSSSLSTWV